MDCLIWQATQGQIRTVEGAIAANQAARTSAIQYNAALKAQTLGAKAAAAALKLSPSLATCLLCGSFHKLYPLQQML